MFHDILLSVRLAVASLVAGHQSHRFRCLIAATLAIALSPVSIRADIFGFNRLDGWTYNQNDNGSPLVIVNDDEIEITTSGGQARSIWFNTQQDIGGFTASFTYKIDPDSNFPGGIAFVVQREGTNNVVGSNSLLGYNGISPSAAVTIQVDNSPSGTFTGFYRNGVIGGGSVATTPVNAYNFRDVDVCITYDGSEVSVSMIEGPNAFGPFHHFVGDLSSALEGSTAFVGFTAGVNNNFLSQFLSDFRYDENPARGLLQCIPEPASASLAVIAVVGVMVNRRWRRRSEPVQSMPSK